MRRIPLIPATLVIVLCSGVLAQEVSMRSESVQQQEHSSPDKPRFQPVEPQRQSPQIRYSVKGRPPIRVSNKDKLEVQNNHGIKPEAQHIEKKPQEVHHTEDHQSGIQQDIDKKQQEMHHTEDHQSQQQQDIDKKQQVMHHTEDHQSQQQQDIDKKQQEMHHTEDHQSQQQQDIDKKQQEMHHTEDHQSQQQQDIDKKQQEMHHTEDHQSEQQQDIDKKQQEMHHTEDHQSQQQQDIDKQQQEMHHTADHQSEVHQSDGQNVKHQVPTGRQFHPPPYHHPMLFQPPTGFEAIRRQLGGGFGSDLVMMGLISLPIIGLLTMGSASIGNLFGLGSSSSSSKKSSSKRNKRSLKEKAADAVEYAKNLWNVMEQLERAFEKYDLYQAECRLRVVCEAHHKDRKMGSWGQGILDLMRQQKELEGRELLPVSRFLFSNYAEAAQAGVRNENCSQLYTGCPRHLSYYLSAKEDQLENEVENGM